MFVKCFFFGFNLLFTLYFLTQSLSQEVEMQELSSVMELGVGVYESKTENCFDLYLQVERYGLFFYYY